MSNKVNSNLQQVDIKMLKNLIPYYFHNRIPLYLWGRPSTGKTSCIRQFARDEAKRRGLRYSEDEYGEAIFTMKVITLSQFDSPDLRGMPEIIKTANGQSITTFVPTAELPRVGQGIIFFDEMNLADKN
jgi:GTPase SAR1 family protein